MGNNSIVNWLRKAGASVLFIGYLPGVRDLCLGRGRRGALVVSRGKLIAIMHISTGSCRTGFWPWPPSAISMVAASRSRELFGKEDSGKIVIDEVAGQLITFLFIPSRSGRSSSDFILFRFFDIIKPWPVYYMEELEEGVGVTMDDVAAGVLANISMLVILFVYHAIKAHL
jgi:phosphatidylglycerophosphatase A